MKVLAVTGYKPFELGIFKQDDRALVYIKKAIETRLRSFIDEGLEWILISGQLGTELWAAETAYDLREEYPELKVAVITPFYGQEEKWKEPNKEMYEAVLAQADYEESLTHRPYESPLQFRQKNAVKQTDIRFIRLRWMISVPPLKKKISLHNTSENI